MMAAALLCAYVPAALVGGPTLLVTSCRRCATPVGDVYATPLEGCHDGDMVSYAWSTPGCVAGWVLIAPIALVAALCVVVPPVVVVWMCITTERTNAAEDAPPDGTPRAPPRRAVLPVAGSDLDEDDDSGIDEGIGDGLDDIADDAASGVADDAVADAC